MTKELADGPPNDNPDYWVLFDHISTVFKTDDTKARQLEEALNRLSALRQSEDKSEPSEAVVERVAKAWFARWQQILWEGGAKTISWDELTRSEKVMQMDCARAALAAHDGEGLLREALVKLRDVQGAYASGHYAENLIARIDTHLSRIGQGER